MAECSACGRHSDAPPMCARCNARAPLYCSAACRQLDAPTHMYTCTASALPYTPLERSPDPRLLTRLVVENTAYRRVLHTGPHMQLVAMSIVDNVGWEVHSDTSQYFLVKQGAGWLLRGTTGDVARAERREIAPLDAWVVDQGTWHDVVAAPGGGALKLLTIYTPPHHPRDRVQLTRAQAEAEETRV